MPYTDNQLKLASALLLVAAAGPATAQGAHAARAQVAKPHVSAANIAANNPPKVIVGKPDCPTIALPILQPKKFLVVNRTSETMACRMRHPTVGGWSGFVNVASGARLIDKQVDLDEIQVQCKPPARATAVRVYPSRRYAFLRNPGMAEVRLVEIVATK